MKKRNAFHRFLLIAATIALLAAPSFAYANKRGGSSGKKSFGGSARRSTGSSMQRRMTTSNSRRTSSNFTRSKAPTVSSSRF